MSVDRLFGLKMRLNDINRHPLDGTGDAWMDRQVLLEALKEEIEECQRAISKKSIATGEPEKGTSWWSYLRGYGHSITPC
jgi:hypothetical protein